MKVLEQCRYWAQLIVLVVISLVYSCKENRKEDAQHAYTNDLIHETSPYLLQHAHNPVDWKPWNKKTLSQAKEENATSMHQDNTTPRAVMQLKTSLPSASTQGSDSSNTALR